MCTEVPVLLGKNHYFRRWRAEFPGSKRIALGNPCYGKPWVTIALRILAYAQALVTIPGHPETRMRLALVTRATHASHPLIVRSLRERKKLTLKLSPHRIRPSLSGSGT